MLSRTSYANSGYTNGCGVLVVREPLPDNAPIEEVLPSMKVCDAIFFTLVQTQVTLEEGIQDVVKTSLSSPRETFGGLACVVGSRATIGAPSIALEIHTFHVCREAGLVSATLDMCTSSISCCCCCCCDCCCNNPLLVYSIAGWSPRSNCRTRCVGP